MADRLELAAWIVSTCIHGLIIATALGAPLPTLIEDLTDPAAAPDPERPEPIAVVQRREALRAATAQSGADTAKTELPPLALQDLPALDQPAPDPQFYHTLADETVRGLGDELGQAPERAETESTLLDELGRKPGKMTDAVVDERRQLWQLTAHGFAGLNRIAEHWRRDWRLRWGPLVSNHRLLLLVEIDDVPQVHVRQLIRGSGCQPVDEALMRALTGRGPTLIPPKITLRGPLTIPILLDPK